MSPEERAHFIQVTAASLERLDRLARRLVDLARADMMRPGRGAPRALAPILATLAERWQARGLAIRISVGVERTTLAEDALEMMLGNLLENALQHAGPDAAVTITARETAEALVLELADTGPGVAEPDAARIFEPFFTTARAEGGTGLGLPITRAIAAAIGGTVELLPAAGKGAVFRITLPHGGRG